MLEKLANHFKANGLGSDHVLSLFLFAYMTLGVIATFAAPTLINMIAFGVVTFIQFNLSMRFSKHMNAAYKVGVEEAALILGKVKLTLLVFTGWVYMVLVFVDLEIV